MGEIEEIILLSLSQANISNIKSLKDLLSSDQLILCICQLINEINKNDQIFTPIPLVVPTTVVQKYKLMNDITKYLKLKKYGGQSGFNQFLYPSLKQAICVIQFLLEEVSKKNIPQSHLFSFSELDQEISQKFQDWKQALFILPIFLGKEKKIFKTKSIIYMLDMPEDPNECYERYEDYFQDTEAQLKNIPDYVRTSTLINLEEQESALQVINQQQSQNEIEQKIMKIDISKLFQNSYQAAFSQLPSLDELLNTKTTIEQVEKQFQLDREDIRKRAYSHRLTLNLSLDIKKMRAQLLSKSISVNPQLGQKKLLQYEEEFRQVMFLLQ